MFDIYSEVDLIEIIDYVKLILFNFVSYMLVSKFFKDYVLKINDKS